MGWDVNVHVNLRQQLMRSRGKSPKMNLRGVKSSCEDVVDARVAQSQWHHWIGNKDPWKTQGEVLKAVRDLQLL